MARGPFDLLRKDGGSTAAEFALVTPAMLLMIFAIFHLSFLLYATTQLRWTVEGAARCGALSMNYSSAQPNVSCQTQSSTKSYALSLYNGPKIGLTTGSFTPSIDGGNGCRNVAVAASYPIRAGFVNVDIPLSANACFPADTTVSWPAS